MSAAMDGSSVDESSVDGGFVDDVTIDRLRYYCRDFLRDNPYVAPVHRNLYRALQQYGGRRRRRQQGDERPQTYRLDKVEEKDYQRFLGTRTRFVL